MHFKHNQLMFWVYAAFVAGPGLTALLRSRLGFRQFPRGGQLPRS